MLCPVPTQSELYIFKAPHTFLRPGAPIAVMGSPAETHTPVDNTIATVPLSPTTLRSESQVTTDDGRYRLNRFEEKWVAYQPYFLEKGYNLRPRYQPNWVPSWTNTGEDPSDCEDSWALPFVKAIDAIRVADQKHVAIKLLVPSQDDDEGKEELSIMEYLSQEELRLDLSNHAVPLLDTFPVPDNPQGVFLVTPFLADWDDYPFVRVGDAMDFLNQLLKGIQFLHSKNIAHRDADIVNIMADVSSLNGEPFHPADPSTSLDGKRELKTKPLSEGSIRYYFIDFGLSSRFTSREERKLVTGWKGRERRAPELHEKYGPYDPFKLDVLTIGYIINDCLLKEYKGFSGLKPLVARMTANDPKDRPDANETYDAYSHWAQKQWATTRHGRLVPSSTGILRHSIISTISFMEFVLTRFRKLVSILFYPLRMLSRTSQTAAHLSA